MDDALDLAARWLGARLALLVHREDRGFINLKGLQAQATRYNTIKDEAEEAMAAQGLVRPLDQRGHCNICGALPGVGCHKQTHEAYDRMLTYQESNPTATSVGVTDHVTDHHVFIDGVERCLRNGYRCKELIRERRAR